MSNRTDFHELALEILSAPNEEDTLGDRLETELHNALVAGREGGLCQCSSCKTDEDKLWWVLTEAGLSVEEIQALDPAARRKITAFMVPRTIRRLTR